MPCLLPATEIVLGHENKKSLKLHFIDTMKQRLDEIIGGTELQVTNKSHCDDDTTDFS